MHNDVESPQEGAERWNDGHTQHQGDGRDGLAALARYIDGVSASSDGALVAYADGETDIVPHDLSHRLGGRHGDGVILMTACAMLDFVGDGGKDDPAGLARAMLEVGYVDEALEALLA